MIAVWMLYGTLIALLAGLAALALERGARLLGRVGRWAWVGAMVVTLALPVAAWYRPEALQPLPVTLLSANASAATPEVTVSAPTSGRHWSWADLNRPLAVGWALWSVTMVAWFAAGAWRLARMRRSWRSEGHVLVSTDVGPAVVGFVHCRVVVPEWSLGLRAEQRDLLLAHEAEHLATHDSRLLLLSATVVALVPWNIGLWWQFKRLQLAIELDCDNRVLRRRPDRATYGRLLLDVGARATKGPVLMPAFHEPTSSLEKRIRSMTAKPPRRARLLSAMLVLGAGAATFLACEAPRPLGPRVRETGVPDVILRQVSDALSKTLKDELVVRCAAVADSMRRAGVVGWVRGADPNWLVMTNQGHVMGVGQALKTSSGAALPTGPQWLDRERQGPTLGPGTTGPGSPPVYCGLTHAVSFPAIEMDSVKPGQGTGEVGLRTMRLSQQRSTGPETTSVFLFHQPTGEQLSPPSSDMQVRLREAVARFYPQYLNSPANPPVALWFFEDSTGNLSKTMQSHQPPGGVVTEERQAGDDGWIKGGPLAPDRRDVMVLWVHPTRTR